MKKILLAKTDALRAIQEWAGDEEPISAIGIFLKSYGPPSQWLKAELGNLTYEKISEMAAARDDEQQQQFQDFDRLRLAGDLKKYIDKIVTPLILIKEIGQSLRPEQADPFAEGIRAMMDGNFEDDVSAIIQAAKRYSPDMVAESRLEFFAGKDQPDELHRTEEGNGPLLAASVKLRLGENGFISISDDENNRGGLGRTTEVYAHINE